MYNMQSLLYIYFSSIYRLKSPIKSQLKGFHLIVLKTDHRGLRGVYGTVFASFCPWAQR